MDEISIFVTVAVALYRHISGSAHLALALERDHTQIRVLAKVAMTPWDEMVMAEMFKKHTKKNLVSHLTVITTGQDSLFRRYTQKRTNREKSNIQSVIMLIDTDAGTGGILRKR
jgi:hypothetical protein